MSTFQTCPGCDSFILSDTSACPECGHVFDATRALAQKEAAKPERRKFQEMFDTCPKCNEQVRSGLVRCWSCNAFMRADVEAKYKEMTNRPQQIIFSDIPKEDRTEFIPSRSGQSHGGYGREVFDAIDDDDDFTLQVGNPLAGYMVPDAPITGPSYPSVGKAAAAESAAKLSAAKTRAETAEAAKEKTVEKAVPAAAPVAETPVAKAPDKPAAKDLKESTDGKEKPAASAPKAPQDVTADDLLGIAVKDENETKKRQRERIEEARRKRILMPCNCGAWIRVNEEQAGRTVRCTQCKRPFVVPEMRKREKAAKAEAKAGPSISVRWAEVVHLHQITATEVVLKPGSLEKTFVPVDIAFHESGLHVIKFAAPAKKSLFGKGGDGPPAVDQQREQVREHIRRTGAVADLPFVELLSVTPENASKIRLVQPITAVQESMFAGVSVFGDGMIVLFLPLESPAGKQSYISLPLSTYRRFAAELKALFGLSIPAVENGVPGKEEYDTVTCFLSEATFPSVRNLIYYKNDPGFTVEQTGYICGTCGAGLTEESRARKKVGGATPKGLGKAKCPKCSNKFGDLQAFKVTVKATSDDDAPADSPAPAVASTPAAPAADKAGS